MRCSTAFRCTGAGEPFSYQGTHFNARDVRALPRPAQDPIPIWIGGNSKRGRRRVAERAQGWIADVGLARAGSNYSDIDDGFARRTWPSRCVPSVTRQLPRDGRRLSTFPTRIQTLLLFNRLVEPDRHREALAEIEQACATWVLVSR